MTCNLFYFSEPRKQQRPGKWDAIMNSIAEGKKKDEGGVDLADKIKEVKSKVFADFRWHFWDKFF